MEEIPLITVHKALQENKVNLKKKILHDEIYVSDNPRNAIPNTASDHDS